MLAGRTRHVYRHSRFYRISPGGPPGDRCLAEETQNRCRTETHQVSVRETLLSSRKKHMALCQRHASVKSPGPAKSTFRGDTEENGIDSGYKTLPGSSKKDGLCRDFLCVSVLIQSGSSVQSPGQFTFEIPSDRRPRATHSQTAGTSVSG